MRFFLCALTDAMISYASLARQCRSRVIEGKVDCDGRVERLIAECVAIMGSSFCKKESFLPNAGWTIANFLKSKRGGFGGFEDV